jgi:hypothetical protein
MQMVQSVANRLYVVRPGSDFDILHPLREPAAGTQMYELVAFEVGTWRELGHRSWNLPIVVGPAAAPP